jgi:hypothetical protein
MASGKNHDLRFALLASLSRHHHHHPNPDGSGYCFGNKRMLG